MINKESLVYEMNLNNNDNIKFEKIRSFKDENMDKFFQDLIKSINKAFVEYKMHYAMDYDSMKKEDFYLEVYRKHNYIDSLDSYFNIRDDDKLAINYFIYENMEGNDLMDFLFDVYRLSKSLMAEDVVICLKLYEEDILNKTVLGIFIKCFDIETADKFFLFRDELFERHEYDVLYKIFMALRGSYD